ncbi:hypothetical protein CMI48_03805 [Candidatus Pacearchaeota archaeon]|nr:hypothetical protein [Candidatus Pacearchaeota archaeon]|tara:strand:- start:710 stop:961 length:252 start_codon:yes stop_codon:yes gene_type:complete
MTQEVTITRGGQITLTKNLREKMNVHEGDKVVLNFVDGSVMVSKKNPSVFKNIEGFLPERFENTLKKIRSDEEERLRRLGIIP